MDPREKLYTDIKQAIEENVPIVAHVGLYNQDVPYASEGVPFERPAVFIEFGEIQWAQFKATEFGRSCEGSGDIRLHVVTDWNDEAYHLSFKLGEDIWNALSDIFRCVDYQVRYPYLTLTNHDHGELLENIDAFHVKYYKQW